MSFEAYLQDKLFNVGFVRNKLIDDLSFLYKEFQSLDHITLSRWVNGNTEPSILKQLLVCNYFNDSILDYYSNHFNKLTTSKILNAKKRKFFIETGSRYSNDIYQIDNKFHCFLEKSNLERNKALFSGVYKRFAISKKCTEVIDKYKHINNGSVIIYESDNMGNISSHMIISHNKPIEMIREARRFLGFYDIAINSAFSDVSHFRNEAVFDFFVGVLAIYFIKNNLVLSDFFFFTRHKDLVFIDELLGAKQISNTIKNGCDNIYPMKISVLKFLSSPFVISQAVNVINNNNFNPDNLIFETLKKINLN
ncbi:hypothetical protein [Photobacterium damselae]|uniref:hypothetical protein n=1 Tax=Photobacterium damselae TaxID=38293 RepID=UPI00083A5B1A|nr:hypothetical protein [Photobacterium damselae]KAB1181084.1 hypothetical protein F6477_05625 [Photobacterium damselae subsp. damselae]MBF7098788.1 hypothetical protein [Photobacterium damselae]NVO74443.1 hypothetical protein [Photobacterium damselae subsp. damselae]QSH58779.1 hypothetical protein A0J47_018950 [Photobacterium damselae subsp. damselae]SPY29522.1 Uncharacterised protein [Photobacterium damselae]